MTALDALLGRAYAARVQRREPEDAVLADFQAARIADAAFESAARARLAAIDDDAILTKDFVSRVFRDFLIKALA